jgi:hypothetical protein
LTPNLFIATPLHDARMHQAYTAGLLNAWQSLPCQWSACNGTGLMRQREVLVGSFLKTDCTHLLWVDSDIGWGAGDAVRLLETGKDFIGGCYARKNAARDLPVVLTGNREGALYEATHVPTGFLLVSRSTIERMIEAFPELRYDDAGTKSTLTALFLQQLGEGTEDLAFCRRWRQIGGQVWLHSGVVLPHYDGNTPYWPDMTELRKPVEAELATAAE